MSSCARVACLFRLCVAPCWATRRRFCSDFCAYNKGMKTLIS